MIPLFIGDGMFYCLCGARLLLLCVGNSSLSLMFYWLWFFGIALLLFLALVALDLWASVLTLEFFVSMIDQV